MADEDSPRTINGSRRPHVAEQIDYLGKVIEENRALVKMLAERLAPVLAPTPRGAGCDGNEKVSVLCPLGEHVSVLRNQLTEANVLLNDLLAALEV